jgi:hypothetical protein
VFALWWTTSVTFVTVSNPDSVWWDKVLISIPSFHGYKVIDFVLIFGKHYSNKIRTAPNRLFRLLD